MILDPEGAMAIAEAAVFQYRSRWAYPTGKGAFWLPGENRLEAAIVAAIGEHAGDETHPDHPIRDPLKHLQEMEFKRFCCGDNLLDSRRNPSDFQFFFNEAVKSGRFPPDAPERWEAWKRSRLDK